MHSRSFEAYGDGPEPALRARSFESLKIGRYFWFSLFAIFLFSSALVASMPASTLKYAFALPDSVNGLTGTLWNGGAQMDGGLGLNWSIRLSRLLTGRLALDVNLTGPQTSVAGKISASLFAFEARGVKGKLGPEILSVIDDAPQLVCTSTALLNDINFSASRSAFGASGQIDVKQGQCAGKTVGAIIVPAMRVGMLSKDKSAVIEVRPTGGSNSIWGSIKVSPPAKVILRVEPQGAQQIPGMPNTRATILEYNF